MNRHNINQCYNFTFQNMCVFCSVAFSNSREAIYAKKVYGFWSVRQQF